MIDFIVDKYLNESYDTAYVYPTEKVGIYTVHYKLHNFTFYADSDEQAMITSQEYINKLSYADIKVIWR